MKILTATTVMKIYIKRKSNQMVSSHQVEMNISSEIWKERRKEKPERTRRHSLMKLN